MQEHEREQNAMMVAEMAQLGLFGLLPNFVDG